MFTAFVLISMSGFEVKVHHPKPTFEVSVHRPASAAPDLSRFACKIRADIDIASGVNTTLGVLTNYHVVKGRKSIVVTCDGETNTAVVVSQDERSDVALLRVNWREKHPEAEFSELSAKKGETLRSAGRCKDGTITVEEHSCVGNARGEVSMTNASNSGRSGSGVFDSIGDLVGIVTGNSVDREPYLAIAVDVKKIRSALSVSPASTTRANYSGYAPWYETGPGGKLLPTSRSHLIGNHHVNPAELEGKSQAELDRIHGREHGERLKQVAAPRPVQKRPVQNCPSGNCPYSRR